MGKSLRVILNNKVQKKLHPMYFSELDILDENECLKHLETIFNREG